MMNIHFIEESDRSKSILLNLENDGTFILVQYFQVKVRQIFCADPVEAPYFSSKAFPPVCVICGTEVDGDGGGSYPMSAHC